MLREVQQLKTPMAGAKREVVDVEVVMVPLPAQGHLSSLLNLSMKIAARNIPVHFVSSASHIRQAKLRSSSSHGPSSLLHFHDFPIPKFSCPPSNSNSQCKFPSHLLPSFAAASHLRTPISALLRSLSSSSRKVVVIHDSLTAHAVQDARFIPNAVSYTFHSISAFTIYLFKKNVNSATIPSLDGCYTEPFLEFVASQYEYQKFTSGYIYNTCRVLEGDYLNLLEKEFSGRKGVKHWALGPFNPLVAQRKHECLKWLEKQENDSVIYVSFGTTTSMNEEQIMEIAAGLKQSGYKFVWVITEADRGDLFSTKESGRRMMEEYEDEVAAHGMGFIVRDWAPQVAILGHRAVGGFMTHCGWNSCMESISMGKPIAGWPIHSDQPRNAFLMCRVLKVGIMVREWERREEVVGCRAVEWAVRKLMGSKEARNRASELGEMLRWSVSEEGGSCRTELESFISSLFDKLSS